jgi:hypothetical protein
MGMDMSSWAQTKVCVAREVRRLKDKHMREDKRRAVKMFASLDVDKQGEF